MMTSKIIANGILRALLTVIVFSLFLFFIYQIQTVIIYLIVSLVATLIANPFVEFLKRRLKFSNTLAVTTVIVFLVLILVGFILMFVPLIVSQSASLSLLKTNEIESNLVQLVTKINVFLMSHNIDSSNLLEGTNLSSKLNFNFVPEFLNSILGTLSSFGMGLASVLFITFFFLKDKILFLSGAKQILPNQHEEKILNSVFKINELLSRYLLGY